MLGEYHLDLHTAKITTLGERAEDSFVISGADLAKPRVVLKLEQDLLAALEDDHAYVRASAALALGRMRAAEAKQKLMSVMQDDWDQTVRSRAREALERLE